MFMLAMAAITLLAVAFFASQRGPTTPPSLGVSNTCNATNGCNSSAAAGLYSPSAAAAGNGNSPGAQAAPAPTPLRQVSADEIVINPASFLGKSISLVAPVGALLPEKSMFTLTCSCGQTQIPVSYKGAFPIKGQRVAVQGTLRQDAGGQYYFDAQSWAYAN